MINESSIRNIKPGEDPELDAKYGPGTQQRIHDETIANMRSEMGTTPESRLQATKDRFKNDSKKMAWLTEVEDKTFDDVQAMSEDQFVKLMQRYQDSLRNPR